jgi:3-dehydroquinate dehydratase/shikimate dehydrogenase
VVAVCEGKPGVWSRLLSPYFGAPLIIGRLDSDPIGKDGEPSIRQLIEDYGFPSLYPVSELYGIVGNRVFQSPSPRLHNAGYRSLNHPAFFLPFYVERFEDFSHAMIEASALDSLGLPVKGLTVVSPFKETAFATAALRSPLACRAGASNMLVKKDGSWEADTTDPDSLAGIMHDGHNLNGSFTAAVVGCGAAGRAIAAALQQAGAHVTLVNRGKERGELAVRLLGLPFVPLSDFQATHFSLVVNATPVGRDDGCMPFDISSVDRNTVVVDLVYGMQPAPLVAGMMARGGAIIDGYDVLLSQVRKQFQKMTGLEMPANIGRQTAAPRPSLDSPLRAIPNDQWPNAN